MDIHELPNQRYIRTTDNMVVPTNTLTKCQDPRFPSGWFNHNGAPIVSTMESDDPLDLVDIGVGIDADGTRHVITKEMLRDLHLGRGEKAFGGVWTESGMDFVLRVFDNGGFRLLHESV